MTRSGRGGIPAPDRIIGTRSLPTRRERMLTSVTPTGYNKCLKTSCKTCQYVLNKKKQFSYNGSPSYQICCSLTCTSDFMVYVIECVCGLLYVGSTVKQFKERMLQHLRAIENNDQKYPMAVHYSTQHDPRKVQVKVFPIDKVEPLVRGGNRELLLRRLESHWILRLQAATKGLNSGTEMYVFV